jgi:hypothetical protein
LTFAPAGKIAVLPCHVDENVQGTVPDLVGEYVLTAVSDRGEYEVIGMDDIEAIIGFDRQKDLLGCDDVSCFADIGGALGVDRLLQVKIAMAGESWAMTAKLINAGEARVESRVTRMLEGDASALLKDIPNLIGKLFGDAPPPAATASTKRTVETTAKPEEPAGPLAPSRYEVGAVQVTGITSVKIDEQTLSIKDGDEALTDSYWTTGLFTRWREASVGRLHFLLEGQAALSTVESFKGDGSGYSGGTSFLTYLHVMQLVRFTIYENLERWLLASTDRVAIDVGVGGFVRVFGAGDAGLIARVAAQLAWFHLGPTWTYSTELGSQISIDAGLRFGIF